MSANAIQSQVQTALGAITQPRHVRDLTVDDQGAVTFTFVLTTADPASLARRARKAVEGVSGVTSVKMSVVDAAPDGTDRPSGRPAGRPAPATAPPPPPTADEMPALGKALAISSGKGGVGKSTVSANLAAALAREGYRVGLMDADIYGPNIPRMFGRNEKPEVQGGKIQPLEAHGVKLMSLGFIVERDAPAIWRGPIIMKIIGQFLRDVAWGELDYFLVDLPPGTGDAQLSLTQSVRLHGAIIVTTPQEMAVGDSLRGAKMFERVGVGVVGIVENMSFFVCPHCHNRSELFLAGGGARLAAELGVPLLGQVPLQAGMAELADRGEPIVVSQPDSPAGVALRDLARTVAARTAHLTAAVPITAPR
ncbi:MAG TPA: Mrp/NBP35 family ATP-binding protein [Gemmatimonadales bacterium]|nr:Mrp/NBP35 family ATP-binding protein [Gemmatimonadales bacterium]